VSPSALARAAAFALVAAFTAWLPAAALADDPPPSVASMANPVAGDPAAVRRGQGLFLQNCAPCHGAEADGRGPGSVGLRPPPADLAGPEVVPKHPDGWLYWRIAHGKRGTAMPSFAFSLSEPERWSIVAFLRSLQAGARPADSAPAPGAARAPLVSAH